MFSVFDMGVEIVCVCVCVRTALATANHNGNTPCEQKKAGTIHLLASVIWLTIRRWLNHTHTHTHTPGAAGL